MWKTSENSKKYPAYSKISDEPKDRDQRVNTKPADISLVLGKRKKEEKIQN